MSYSEQIRHPGGALDPQGGVVNWWWFILAGIAALVLIAIFRPQWLTKIGVHLPGAAKAVAAVANPMRWV